MTIPNLSQIKFVKSVSDQLKEFKEIDHFGEELGKPLSFLLGLGRSSGADFVEFFLEKRCILIEAAENQKISSIEPTFILGAGIRVLKGKKDAYVSTNDVTFVGLKKALINALDLIGLNEPSPENLLMEVNLEPLRDYGTRKQKNVWFEQLASIKDLSNLLLNAQNIQQKSIKHAQSTLAQCKYDWQEVLIAASDSTFARDIRLNQNFMVQALCLDKGNRAASGKRLGGTSQPHFFQNLNPTVLVDELAETLGKTLYADYVEAGNYPVVLANRFGGVIFHEACGHLLETTAVQKKATPFWDKMGEMIAHQELTAWDEGVWPDAFGTIDMDDEGMPAQRTLLIENGRLKNFICDRAGQLFTGYPRTGSGRRQNYTFAPASRMRNTYIGTGKYTPDDIIASIDKGIYCKNLGGGSVGSTGEFNFAVEEAYLIENGKIGKPVKGATLIGDAKDVMQKISMAAGDLDISSGLCGSVSGTVYVTVGQPHIKVDAITVGGRS